MLKINKSLLKLTTKDNLKIALWKISSDKKNNQHVFLTHGTFSNKKIMIGIANYLANLGYTCWILEWRNHGSSAVAIEKFNLETIGFIDIKTALDFLINKYNANNIHCITHSGGGIALTMFLSTNNSYTKHINSIVFFNCQAFGAVNSKFDYVRIFIAKYFSYFLGYIPGVKLGLGIQNEKYYLMKSWYNWNLNKTFKGIDGFDYMQKMKTIKVPILSICGENDTFIAPKQGCEKYLNKFENPKNKLIVCSIKNGFNEDYNHSRTLLSKNASKEVWQIAQNWIEENQT